MYMSFKQKIQSLEKKYHLKPDDFNGQRRKLNQEIFSDEIFDLAIVGGGITGAALASEASQSGLKVALIEASHFGSGTSSKSSKLIHGGLRYLEQWDFKLVFESLKARNQLLKHNGHLVKTLPFIFPVYKGDRLSTVTMSIGFWLYDILSLFKMGKHSFLSKKQLLKKYPNLESKNLKGAFVYIDAQANDSLLTRANIITAFKNNAVLNNYSELKKIHFDNTANRLEVYDKLLDKFFFITAKHSVLSLGPWTDHVCKKLFFDWTNVLNLSKGSHLCVKKERLACAEALVINSNIDQRIIFIIPQKDYTLVGTTESHFDANPDCVKTTEKDIDYLLKQVNQFFPKVFLEKKDCLSYFSGLRPLLDLKQTSSTKASREHIIALAEKKTSFVAGGKFTTHKKMAKDILKHIYKVNKNIKKGFTKKNERLENLIFLDQFAPAAKQAIEKEMCVCLSDFFKYHISLGMQSKINQIVIDTVSQIFVNYYLWSKEDLQNQQKALRQSLQDCGIRLQTD